MNKITVSHPVLRSQLTYEIRVHRQCRDAALRVGLFEQAIYEVMQIRDLVMSFERLDAALRRAAHEQVLGELGALRMVGAFGHTANLTEN